MAHAIAAKVPFNKKTVSKCMCPDCPVQTESSCVSSKMSKIKDALARDPLKQEDIPGVYCATGLAACKDIDLSKDCICGSCAVFSDYNLGIGQPQGYYCRDGAAK
ncbi:MAG: DUF2769 domain-containing protein [Chloroflexi bacterium]|nr:DUF2769 domain-containing protein [Chloroflexota bacterium]